MKNSCYWKQSFRKLKLQKEKKRKRKKNQGNIFFRQSQSNTVFGWMEFRRDEKYKRENVDFLLFGKGGK